LYNPCSTKKASGSSFHSVFQSRQHALGPDGRFRPRPTGRVGSGVLSRSWHSRRGLARRAGSHASISLRPFAPRALPRFVANMDALTPVRSVLGILIRDIERRSCFRTGLSASCVWPSDPSVSNHLARPRDRFRTQPLSVASSPLARVWASPLSSRLAARPGRIEFVILRTSRSPPVALHPASRRRSYLWLQAGVRIPEKDLHLSDQTHLQTH